MTLVHREYTYTLTLVDSSGLHQRLATHRNRPTSSNWSTEHDFSSSPTGHHLAYAVDDNIVVRDLQGKELRIEHVANGLFRFSSDGSKLAYAKGDNEMEISVLDLESKHVSTLGSLPNVTRLKWTRNGLLAGTQLDKAGRRTSRWDQVMHFASSGTRTRVFSGRGHIDRFVAHNAQERVIVFRAKTILELRLRDGQWHSRLVGRFRSYVKNAEMSKNGDVAFANDQGLFLLIPGKEPRRISRSKEVHSVWFHRGGDTLAFSTPERVSKHDVATGTERHWTPKKERITSLRFGADEDDLIITTENRVYSWRSASATPRFITMVPGRELGGADIFGRKTLLWSSAASYP